MLACIYILGACRAGETRRDGFVDGDCVLFAGVDMDRAKVPNAAQRAFAIVVHSGRAVAGGGGWGGHCGGPGGQPTHRGRRLVPGGAL